MPRCVRLSVLLALSAGGGALLMPAPAGAHPLTGGPVTGPQVAVLGLSIVLAVAGWAMVARGGSRLRRPGYVLLIAGALGFVAGPNVIVWLANLGAPTTSIRLVLVTPLDGQTIESAEIPISVRLFEPAGAGWRPVAPSAAGGHIHVAVDGRLVNAEWTPSSVVAVPGGAHVVTVEYVARDHRSFSPPVLAIRRITARPAGAGAAGVPSAVLRATLSWRDWSWDPMIASGLAAAILGYAWLARRFPPRRWQAVSFWGGILVLVVALLSPIDVGSAYLFTIHMVQHMLLLLVAAPLFALAVPAALVGRWYQIPPVARVLHAVWSPWPAFTLFAGVLVFWHLPFAYDATLVFRPVHVLEHLSFLAAGIVFWGVIVSPAPKLVRASLGVRFGLVIAADLVNFLVGFALAFAGRPLYRHYVEAPRLWGLSPLDDLRLGGGVMWVMGQMMYAIPVLILLSVFLRREDTGRRRPGPTAAAPNASGR